MNYLAHLHLASLANSSLLGNIMADYVRGNPYTQWSTDVADGIALHRRIDALTDSLPEVREARGWFRAETRRVSPITLDVVWDHFLSHHWDKLVPEVALPDFLADAQRTITPDLANTPERFQQLNHYLWQDRWMERYADAGYLQKVLQGMASRRPRLAALAESYQDFAEHYHQLEALFWQLYPRMMRQAADGTL
ncbi:ACP phosphodiesterase [Erwinia sp. Leaf53]|uniref:ACP phosphodiesterase n=1 Tax=Erwinia sp. Leaf53 TaxID=1736225 RepID=UPI0006F418DC|nr:ACP phosphodiesterase [Erwinia sp. Leaf53]KQN63103.1 ACP phosphodiesterase [Erwinia sp. Leaf53]